MKASDDTSGWGRYGPAHAASVLVEVSAETDDGNPLSGYAVVVAGTSGGGTAYVPYIDDGLGVLVVNHQTGDATLHVLGEDTPEDPGNWVTSAVREKLGLDNARVPSAATVDTLDRLEALPYHPVGQLSRIVDDQGHAVRPHKDLPGAAEQAGKAWGARTADGQVGVVRSIRRPTPHRAAAGGYGR